MDKKPIKWYIFWDAVASLAVWVVFYLYRRLTNDFALSDDVNMPLFSMSFRLSLSAFVFVSVTLFMHYLSGAYIRTAPRLRLVELFGTVVSTLLTSIVIFFILLANDHVVEYQFYYKSFLILWGLLFFVTYLLRSIQTWKLLGRISLEEIDIIDKNDPLTVPMKAWQQAVKRIFDIVASGVLMIILSPLFAFIIVRILTDANGSIFYKQERRGMHGKHFMIIKFRSMYEGAEKNGPMVTLENDERITPFGKIMRRYRMDELPQLWNIIKGDMSIVGPRPERDYFIEQIEKVAPRYKELYRVRPGLLSWGPIKVGYSDTIEKMVRRLDYDLEYLNNMSIQTDIKIMVLSVRIILLGKGR